MLNEAIISRLFRRHWWQFWKPRMPVITPKFVLMAMIDPNDTAGYLTPAELQAITKHARTALPNTMPGPLPGWTNGHVPDPLSDNP